MVSPALFLFSQGCFGYSASFIPNNVSVSASSVWLLLLQMNQTANNSKFPLAYVMFTLKKIIKICTLRIFRAFMHHF